MPRFNKGPKQREQARKKRRTVLLVTGLSLLFYLTLSFFLGEKGLFRYIKLRQQKAGLTDEIAALRSSNDELRRRVGALKTDPEYIERLAREQGMVKEGETVYQYEEEK